MWIRVTDRHGRPVALLERIDYDARQHAVYAAGRALSEEMRRVWIDAFSKWANPRRPLTVLDLGSGTGRFTPALAEAFGGPVYGVEPSERMRQVAEQTGPRPGVHYLAGSAESIPLPDEACDLVLMFLAFHHVRDRRAAVAEIRRVVRPGARMLLRSTFSDRMPDLLWHRAISTFEYLAEEEIRQGFAAMDRAVQAEAVPRPVTSDGDVLVLAASGQHPGEQPRRLGA
jgi:ubiquinone/menaquinone biosynthesis C-methylase UbiE